jgi:hypothetical protein
MNFLLFSWFPGFLSKSLFFSAFLFSVSLCLCGSFLQDRLGLEDLFNEPADLVDLLWALEADHERVHAAQA